MYYEKIVKESKNANPSRDVINNYLNIEFPTRGNWIKIAIPEYRSQEFFKTYPCFSDPIEVWFSRSAEFCGDFKTILPK